MIIELRGYTWKQISEEEYKSIDTNQTAVFISEYLGEDKLTFFKRVGDDNQD